MYEMPYLWLKWIAYHLVCGFQESQEGAFILILKN